MDTSELGLSAIIAWLLDLDEDHGQGAAFLDAFVEHFGIGLDDPGCLSRASVTVEAVTDLIAASKRRMDIEVNCGSFLIAIENKPFASFQPRQIADYCAHLSRKAGDHFALVILKGWPGRTPKDQLLFLEEQQCQVVDSDYRALQGWIRLCRERCEAPSVREFLAQFDSFIDAEIVTGMTSKEEGIVLATVTVDREQTLAALDLIAAASSLYQQLHNSLVSEVRQRLRPGWQMPDDPSVRERKISSSNYYLTIDFDPALPILFAFDMYYGSQHANFAIRERLQERPPVRKLGRIKDVLKEELPGFEYAAGSWLWWAGSSALADERLIRLADHNIWKAAVDPGPVAEEIVKMAGRLETIFREALGDQRWRETQ